MQKYHESATGGIAGLFSASCRIEYSEGCAKVTRGNARPHARRAQPASGAGGIGGRGGEQTGNRATHKHTQKNDEDSLRSHTGNNENINVKEESDPVSW